MRLIGAIVLALLSIAGLSLDATDAVAAPNPDDFAINENTGGRIDVSANKGGQPTTAQTPVVKRGVSAPVQPEVPIDCGVVTQDPTARFLDACSVATPQFGTTAPQPTRQQQQASYAVNYYRLTVALLRKIPPRVSWMHARSRLRSSAPPRHNQRVSNNKQVTQ